MSNIIDDVSVSPAPPGPEILLDTDLLSGASSPVLTLNDDPMESDLNKGATGNGASDQSLEFSESLANGG